MSHRWMPRLSVRAKLLASFFAMTALAAALLLYGILTSARLLQERTVREMEVLAVSEANEIQATADRLPLDVVAMSGVPSLRRYLEPSKEPADLSERSRISDELLIFAKAKKCYCPVRVRLADKTGREIVRLEDSGSGLASTDPSQHPMAEEQPFRSGVLLPRGSVHVSPVVRAGPNDAPGADGGTQIEVVTPLVDPQGRHRGVLAVRVRLDYLLTHVGQRPPDGGAFLVDEEGRYLAHDRPAGVTRSSASDSPRGVHEEFDRETAGRILSGNPGTTIDGTGMIVGVAPIRIGNARENRYWVFGMTAPKGVILSPVHAFLRIAILVLIAAVMGFMALVALLSRHFTVPLGKLCKGAETIAAGDLDHRIIVSTGDEMERLASKFNEMTASLAKARHEQETWNERLRTKVEEQTIDLRQAEERVRAEKQKLDDIVSSMGAELSLISRDRRVLWANRVLAEARGGLERVVGRPCYEVLRRRDRMCEDCYWLKTIGNGQVYKEVRADRDPSGQETISQIIVTPVCDAKGNAVELLRLSVDITESMLKERTSRAQLARAETLSALGRLAAGVVHDVANPLTAIKTTLEVMADDMGDNAKVQRYVGRAVRELDELAKFLRRFTLLAKPDPPEFLRRDVNAVIREILALLDGDARKRGVALRRELHAGELPADVDASRLRQVILNLVINALDATDAGGAVTVATCRGNAPTEGDGAHPTIGITVADSGSGMKPEVLDHIFDPFFTTKPNGTGLGLTIAHRIVHEHGGRIRVDSTVGKGSTFRIELPQDRPRALDRDLATEDAVAVGTGSTAGGP